jgi:predicted acyltransferase
MDLWSYPNTLNMQTLLTPSENPVAPVESSLPKPEPNRVLSVDFLRGFTMFMLVSGITGLFVELVNHGKGGPSVAAIGEQLEHVDWVGLHAWDLIQPFFMFIVGVAMPFSLTNRLARGDTWNQVFRHALLRSFLLLLFGWMVEADGPTYNLCNVLAQLSVTYLVAFLLMQAAVKWQLVVSFAMILITDLLYRFWPMAGFNQPFTSDHNFGSWVDIALTGHLGPGGWVSFNAIPTSAHTIWGVLVGWMLLKDWPPRRKILTLLGVGTAGVVTGYAMNPLIPIIKHTCTSSFIIVSGGWCLVAMAFSYWLIDMLNFRRLGLFFGIVGMNPIFIYLFSHRGGKGILSSMARPFTHRLFASCGEMVINMATVTVVAAMMWYLCYFLHKRKIFIRL